MLTALIHANGLTFLICYDKCFYISKTFLFLFSNKLLIIRAGIHKILVRITNMENPNQTASSEVV